MSVHLLSQLLLGKSSRGIDMIASSYIQQVLAEQSNIKAKALRKCL